MEVSPGGGEHAIRMDARRTSRHADAPGLGGDRPARAGPSQRPRASSSAHHAPHGAPPDAADRYCARLTGCGGLARVRACRSPGPRPCSPSPRTRSPMSCRRTRSTRAPTRRRTCPAGRRRSLAVITCMDSRIDPLNVLGMKPGDVKILRNAGARVTDDVLRTLVLATYLLGVRRVLVMPHTDCKMASGEEADVHQSIHGEVRDRHAQRRDPHRHRPAVRADHRRGAGAVVPAAAGGPRRRRAPSST